MTHYCSIDGEGPYRAACICGWCGGNFSVLDDAEEDAALHLEDPENPEGAGT